MAGRPATVQEQILRYAAEHGGAIDLQLDGDELTRITKTGNLPAALHRLRQKRLLHTVQRGRYVLNTDRRPSRMPRLQALDPLAAVVLRRLDIPWFLSWHSALWHHSLIDQQASQLYVAVRRRKRTTEVGRARIRYVYLVEHKFFGFDSIIEFGANLKMATVEKALLDSFDHPRLAAPMPVVANALRTAWQIDRLDPDRLVSWALDFNSPALNRRLGFFMEFYDIPGYELLEAHLGRDWAVPLEPGGDLRGDLIAVNRRWRVAEDPTILVAARSQR